MTLLTPLGLLALLSVVALIIIYIIRPNYQQKFVSSTFVWKLALKRKRKRIPTSKLRNILLIICQVMILLSLTALLTTPSQPLEVKSDAVEIVAIVDASASMRTKDSDNVSRFERALDKVKILADEAFNNNGLVSLMFAGNTNKFVVEKVTREDRELLDTAIDEALGKSDEESECTYGKSDLDQAVLMCQEVIETNPSTQIYVYSDIDYGYVPKKDINYERIYDTSEGNLAILNAYAELVNSYYNFHIDVASYGKDAEITLDVFINNANSSESFGGTNNIVLQDLTLRCTDSTVTSLVICSEATFNEDDKTIAEEKGVTYLSLKDCYSEGESGITNVYSFESINVQIDLNGNQVDSYTYDNSFNIYGGKKEQIKVEYVSTKPCIFMQTILEVGTNYCSEYWDMRIDEKQVGYNDEDNTTYATEGYDVYFFEHKMPEILPVDGVVVLIDPSPSQTPYDGGFSVVRQETLVSQPKNFVVESNHNLFANVNVADIQTTKFTYLKLKDEFNYKVVASVNRSPVIAVREEVGGTPVVLMGFDLHHSNFPALMKDFVVYMLNLYDHFLPPTVKSHAFEVYENIEVNARSAELTVADANTNGNMFSRTLDTFPSQISFEVPGTYEFSQTTYANKNVTDTVYVRCPMSESNIFEKKDALIAPYKPEVVEEKFKDLMFYVAIALAVLLFLEWFLQSRENM